MTKSENVAVQRQADTAKKSGDGKDAGNVGDALRAVYRDAVNENVPDEMLDLLSKLT